MRDIKLKYQKKNRKHAEKSASKLMQLIRVLLHHNLLALSFWNQMELMITIDKSFAM